MNIRDKIMIHVKMIVDKPGSVQQIITKICSSRICAYKYQIKKTNNKSLLSKLINGYKIK